MNFLAVQDEKKKDEVGVWWWMCVSITLVHTFIQVSSDEFMIRRCSNIYVKHAFSFLRVPIEMLLGQPFRVVLCSSVKSLGTLCKHTFRIFKRSCFDWTMLAPYYICYIVYHYWFTNSNNLLHPSNRFICWNLSRTNFMQFISNYYTFLK